MVVRGVMVTGVTAVTVYLVLVLVEPPRLTLTIATIFRGVRARRRTVAAVASHRVLATVYKHHCHQVGRVQGSNSHSR